MRVRDLYFNALESNMKIRKKKFCLRLCASYVLFNYFKTIGHTNINLEKLITEFKRSHEEVVDNMIAS